MERENDMTSRASGRASTQPNVMGTGRRSHSSLPALRLARRSALVAAFVVGCAVSAAAQSVVLNPTQDTWLSEKDKNRNYGASNRMSVEGDPGRLKRALLQFDVSSIPAGAVLTSATLTVWKQGANNAADSLAVHVVTQAWVEGTGSNGSGASWNTYDGSNGWASPGGDYVATPSSVILAPLGNGPKTLDVLSLVQAWVSGTVPNHGLLIRQLYENAGVNHPQHNFRTRDDTIQPTLTITYGAPPDIVLLKSLVTASDPVNGAANPKAIPGASVLYTVAGENMGGMPDTNSVVLVDVVPANTALLVSDLGGPGTGPVAFVDGAVSSGLTYTFLGLGSGLDDVQFSNNGGASYGYTPVPDAFGADSTVTHVRVTPRGVFTASSGAPHPGFRVQFQVRVN